MRCPYCRIDHDKVIDSRASGDGSAIRRRRECLHCERRFTTYERCEPVAALVIKRDGHREEYDPAKVRSGVEKACSKLDIPTEKIEECLDRVDSWVRAFGEEPVTSVDLGRRVVDELGAIHPVARVRFSAVYNRHQDVAAIAQDLEPILRRES